jgi:hypothetical protein
MNFDKNWVGLHFGRFFHKRIYIVTLAFKNCHPSALSVDQGCQVFLDTIYPNGNLYQLTSKLPNDPKIYQISVIYLVLMAVKYIHII